MPSLENIFIGLGYILVIGFVMASPFIWFGDEAVKRTQERIKNQVKS